MDAAEYNPDRSNIVTRAHEQHVTRFVLPAVHVANFDKVRQLAHQIPGAYYCLGIHPLYVQHALEHDLNTLRLAIQAHLHDPKLVGVGEIGLDLFISNSDLPRQLLFFEAQLRMACDFNLPVVLHIRKAQDLILKHLRRFQPCSGIAHAFNGSFQQAEQFIALHMKLGFGGACTFSRALQIRRLVTELPLDTLVLETDGPDMAPEWINHQRNAPEHLPRIAQHIAELRQITLPQLSVATQANFDLTLHIKKTK